jgi:hypothetical protein
VLAGLAVWLVVAVLVGASGVLARVRPPVVPAVLAALTAGLLALLRWGPGLRAWALAVDVRALVLFHVTRFVGILFLVLHARGRLPWAFAVPGGWGDIAVATAAVLLVLLAPRRGRTGWWLHAAWNTAGLLDILGVVATAARLVLRQPDSMRELTVLPLSLLPTFVVPVIIATHVVIWARLRRSRRAGYAPLGGEPRRGGVGSRDRR